jgi:lysozyme
MPDPIPTRGPVSKRTLVAIVGAGAAAIVLGISSTHEGVRLTPYDDVLGGHVASVCFGETNVAMRRYTLGECKQLLATSLAGYAAGVQASTPGFDALTDGQKAAAIDFAYNAGLGTWQVSSIRNAYARHDFPAACQRFMLYTFTNHGKIDCNIAANKCAGIPARRRAERSACLGD